ncbi:MAG: rod shape-determining protein RodA [Bacteroidales bacterium]|nr:rod shape-determining protein RodA [Bacteroidales bacterium]MDD2426249.1 rod shape-determining protein RodA [Bacteroidales bacterium]MDD3989465.1 rod shape-determining protein RodA [Bacteroidales bacterium]MDD4638493.1 rod shape-determining protein RodA [Bacteroidales bacterium]
MNTLQLYRKLDWPLITCYLILVISGWLSVFSSVYDPELSTGIMDFSQRSGMQFIWIVSSLIIAALIIFVINPKVYNVAAWIFYGISIILLLSVLVLGVEVNGSRSWLVAGPLRIQPAEFSKITTSLALASLLGGYNFRLKNLTGYWKTAAVILIPMMLIVMEKETGSALVYLSFTFMLYREGLSGWVIILGLIAILLFVITLTNSPFISITILFSIMVIARGIFTRNLIRHILFLILYLPLIIFSPRLGNLSISKTISHWPLFIWPLIAVLPPFVYHIISTFREKKLYMWNILLSSLAYLILIFSVNIVFDKVLQEHQKARIENLLGITEDLQGAGYNVHQSKIAIGSGGFAGKGFLQGTQTKFNFVPEQSTDFIFCTVGEEYGFMGSLFILLIYTYMLIRIISLAEKQKDTFARVYGYCVASVIFLHFFINIGMTIGLVPVIGIPLPFISYGGSSLWSFTILLFIFIRLDLERWR